ncbi:MAG: hypothetical protein MJ237_04195 [bacterium]|nr:hypothetical protein [bacterium]
MAFTIITKNNEKTFTDKELVNISSHESADYRLDLGFSYLLTVQYDVRTNTCILLNQFNNEKFLFKGKALPAKLEIDKVCKIMINNSDEFITIKVIGESIKREVAKENITENDMKAIYGNDINASAKLMIEKRKGEIEAARVSIIKEIGATITSLKNKISMNSKSGIIMHIALFMASFVCAFGVSNYLTGLPLNDAVSVIQMPVNMKLIFVYSIIIMGVGLILKQGIFLYFQNKLGEDTNVSRIAEKFMIAMSLIFYSAIYLINVLYYISPKEYPVFAVLISLFFVGTTATLALACGYFKNANTELRKSLDKYEYREDLEHVIKEYQQWIERYINTLSNTKIQNIKDRLFNIQIKSAGEILLGIVTAPFLAYGVSNTLAMCFPEAAGWIRISGLRFSPVFLVLATFLIIFAFFAFVNGFLCSKKIQASEVLKNDGFSNYLQHSVEIYGLEGVKKLDKEMRRSFVIGLVIVIIEFSMNSSYFMQEIGGDLSGILLSMLAALVPTALLIAETFMLSQTRFENFACDELIAKVDRD